MNRRVSRHPGALRDVEESAIYIGQDAPEVAFRFLDAVEATLRLLANNAEIGHARAFPHPGLAGLRSFAVRGFEKHLIFYRPTADGIEVLRVLHSPRDLGAALGE